VEYEILLAVSMKIMIFGGVVPCSLEERTSVLGAPAVSVFRIEEWKNQYYIF
jgi:hypothetical protein